MHGRGSTSRSLIWTVLSSRIRLPASQDRTMFCAIWSCGPAAGPSGDWRRGGRGSGTEVSRSAAPCPELPRRQVEDLLLPLVLAQHPPQQRAEGRADQLRHGPGRTAFSARARSGTGAPSGRSLPPRPTRDPARPGRTRSEISSAVSSSVMDQNVQRARLRLARVGVDPAAEAARERDRPTPRPRGRGCLGSGPGSRRPRSCPGARCA